MHPKLSRALVTGGAGFIGSNLVDGLMEQGIAVRVLDDLSTGKRQNLEHVMQHIEFTQGDVRNLETVKNMAQGCDVIFHQAAVVSVPLTVKHPILSSMVNDMGTLNVLEAARTAGVKRVVLASSCAVYGDAPGLPKDEGMALKPQTPYAVQKYTNELNAGIYSTLYGLETVCLRYFNVFGPRQDPSSPYSGVISIFMNKALIGQRPVIYGDGSQYRDFVYVEDVVKANLLAAQTDNASNEIFNIGTGKSTTINALWSLIAALASSRIEPNHEEQRAGDIFGSVAEIAKANDLLEYAARCSIEDGLRLTYAWYLQNFS